MSDTREEIHAEYLKRRELEKMDNPLNLGPEDLVEYREHVRKTNSNFQNECAALIWSKITGQKWIVNPAYQEAS